MEVRPVFFRAPGQPLQQTVEVPADAPLRDRVIAAMRTVYDPELPVNIYDLGLVYEVAVRDEGVVDVTMTLTSPNCPEAEQIPIDVQEQVEAVEGVSQANVEIVWDPPWTPALMSEAAQLELGMI